MPSGNENNVEDEMQDEELTELDEPTYSEETNSQDYETANERQASCNDRRRVECTILSLH